MSDSPGLVDFAIELVNFELNWPDRQVKFFEEFKLKKNCEINIILLIKMFLGLVEMTFGLAYASFSLPEWQGLRTVNRLLIPFLLVNPSTSDQTPIFQYKTRKFYSFRPPKSLHDFTLSSSSSWSRCLLSIERLCQINTPV